MKKKLLSLILIHIATLTIAQKGFESKTRMPAGEPVKGEFETITAKQNQQKNNPRIAFSPKQALKKILKDEETGAVIYINNPVFTRDQRNARKNSSETTSSFLNSLKNDLKINNIGEEFRLVADETDDLGLRHIKLEQTYKNIPIYGGEAVIHTNKNGVAEFLMGKIFPSPNLNVSPNISPSAAIELSLKDLGKNTIVQKSGNINQFLKLDPDVAELTILNENKKNNLVYHITVRPNILERWVYFIDAHSGEVINKYNHTCTLDGVVSATSKDLNGITKTFNTVQVGSQYYMIDATKNMYNPQSSLPDNPKGVIWTIDAQNSRIDAKEMDLAHVSSTSRTNWNPTAVSAHINASICYDYYLSKFNRNSLNGSKGNIISVINIADEDGKGMDNAYWNGQFMGYGNGKDGFKPLAGALDVAGHEMTHGVIENTAKLEYRNQSGALNESFADIFGALIDRDDWTLGEDVVKTNVFPSGALRSLENPNQGGKNDNGYQPKNMSQYQFLKDTPSEDNGGVHINSGIPNHAFFKFATGAGMNKDKAERVYWRAMTTYLTRTSKFADLRVAVIQAAKDIYGEGQETTAARAAFDFVGISDGTTSNNGNTGNTGTGNKSTDNTIPTNPGTESLVAFDPTDNSLYSGVFTGSSFAKITNGLGCLGKPSITDDGSFVYFVSKDFHIYRVDLTKKSEPQRLSSDPSWRNVAISKDGKQLAALASKNDTYIYVFDLVNNKNKRFELYNPTYTQGVSTGEVLYADSFEWDYSGEFIIYDAFNEAKTSFKKFQYWDVGIIRVWDPLKKDFSDGVIEKMFSNLEEGDNIGNPALAKTNTGIYAFDYFVSNEEVFYVVTIDFGKSTDNVKVLEENNDIGYPNFTKADSKVLFNAKDKSKSVIKGVNLKNDKISPNGASEILFTDAKWGITYATGTRALPTKETQSISINAISDKLPRSSFEIVATASSKLGLIYSVVSGDATINGKIVTLGSTPGKVTIRAIQVGDAKYASTTADVVFCITPPTPRLTDGSTSVTASGGTLYQFYVNNNPVGGQTTNNTFSKDFGGVYTVRNVTADGCASLASNAISAAVLANEPVNAKSINIAPNPVEEFINLTIPADEKLVAMEILDNSGKSIRCSTKITENVKSLSSGQYILKVQTDKNTYSLKMLKK
ncbi:M4 family metallopeptidase [Lacihabitans soyangensis]|uniref:T9SS C-terminal target domain-containing protein n=1 Tax=Lacihabitans soyangensis TaxID=869394 RepID=A0AAE3H4C3_9BACT|nr:M4 family metallopeptidase [Lacihabitans soyangensis]MCP9764698.1 T9SS C-terminal target domain-containing protein [Lacihabitans soyangensis]